MAYARHQGVRRERSLSAVSIRSRPAGHGRRGTFLILEGVRRGWSLSVVSVRSRLAGHGRPGRFSTPGRCVEG
eukprot:7919666-Pyramimonas_sp.AAC.1